MKKLKVGTYEPYVMKMKRKVYKVVVPELNALLRTAELMGYQTNVNVRGTDGHGAFVYTLYKGDVKHKVSILHVNYKADRIVAVINGKDYTQILDSKSPQSDWFDPIKLVLHEL